MLAATIDIYYRFFHLIDRDTCRQQLSAYICVICGFLLPASPACADTPLPNPQQAFLQTHCLDCHDEQTKEGEINLELTTVDWAEQDSLHTWERVLNVLESGEMPPPDASDPSASERTAMTEWLDGQLSAQTPIGGTLARRLNKAEYKATIKSLFGIKDFELPQGFPIDREHHGFDNLGEGLVMSPPLLESYAEAARLVADTIFPPARPTAHPETHLVPAKDLVISYSSAKLVDDALRLGMKCDPIQRSCTWPGRFEAKTSGIYTLTIELSTFRPNEGDPPMVVRVLARNVADKDSIKHNSLRLLLELEVTSESPETFTFDAELYEGQTPVLHWANATLDSDRDDKEALKAFFAAKGTENPKYLAAWHAMLDDSNGQGFRGGIGWERLKKQLARDDLPELSDDERTALLKKIASNPVLYAETVVFDVFENGPALEIHSLQMEGPHKLVAGPQEAESERIHKQLWGDSTTTEHVIRRLLKDAFRRPADDLLAQTYIAIYDNHVAAGHSPEEAMHLVIRNVLISPRFLYRCLKSGPLDDHDLATRLSYFLTGGPPDAQVRNLVDQASITNKEVLRKEAMRLLPTRADAPLVKNFTEQWLDTRLLSEIMPDPRFKFQLSDEQNAKAEVEHFFFEILQDNRPMTDFIDPDFTWTSARIAKNVYGFKEGFDKKKSKTVHRVSLPRGGRVGGLLGQSAVMMATANGVDTQPVLRGVWVLENILGSPVPPPPNAVPPITPDTTTARTPRELLNQHTAQPECASCHRKIDPVGLVLENFDAVGRWREKWPDIEATIDASATLPDGTEIRDVVEFKRWLVKNIDQFSECLATKLMTYATGRVPNYSERREIATIVKANHEAGNGFRDLVLGLIESETFRTK